MTLSPKVLRLVRPSLSSMNPHWVFSITFLSFTSSEMTSQKAYSRTFLGLESRLSGMLWPGSSLLSLKMTFSSHWDLPQFPISFEGSGEQPWTCIYTINFSGFWFGHCCGQCFTCTDSATNMKELGPKIKAEAQRYLILQTFQFHSSLDALPC